MPSSREIRSRIKSVKSTQKITQAMNLVSSSKLQRAKSKLENTRPFSTITKEVIASLIAASKGVQHDFLTERQNRKCAIIVITSDRGLCGGYNSMVSKEAMDLLNKKDDAIIIAVGSKGRDFFSRKVKNEITSFTGISEKPTSSDAAKIGNIVIDLYKQHKVDEIYLVYTVFKSVLVHDPVAVKLLPLVATDFKVEKEAKAEPIMEYEPSPEVVLDYVVPTYINSLIFSALTESSASEQGARMTAMDSATDNAGEIVDKLTLQYNRARQGYITQEVTEIVSGANALE